ncbi:hypothetical protein MY11210_002603 [Beauveria gryllotalpidicola]
MTKLSSAAHIHDLCQVGQQPRHPRCMPSAAAFRAYMLGLYYVLGTLTAGFTVVLWEGCASAGGRFDAGRLPYFGKSWDIGQHGPRQVASPFGLATDWQRHDTVNATRQVSGGA